MQLWAPVSPNKCLLCGTIVVQDIGQHFSKHHNHKMYKCTYTNCTSTFASYLTFLHHVNKFHRSIKPYGGKIKILTTVYDIAKIQRIAKAKEKEKDFKITFDEEMDSFNDVFLM